MCSNHTQIMYQTIGAIVFTTGEADLDLPRQCGSQWMAYKVVGYSVNVSIDVDAFNRTGS